MTGIFLLSIALYLPSIKGDFVWEDAALANGHALGGNTFVAAFTKPFLGHYFRPLTSASFVFDSLFATQTAFSYHQTNILLHAITAVLIACLAMALTQKQWAGILAGLFFATQPIQVGAAAWIGGRTDALSAMFVAAFLVTLVVYHQTSRTRWLAATTVCFFLAALSKEQALAILPAVPLSVFVFGSRKWKDALRICIPFGAAVLVFIGLWAIDAPEPVGARTALPALVILALRTYGYYGLAFLTPNVPSLQTYTLENYAGYDWVGIGLALAAGTVWFIARSWKAHRDWAWLAVCALLVYIPISNFPAVPSFVVGPYRCGEAGAAFACLFGMICASAFSSRHYLVAWLAVANLGAGTVVSWLGIHQWLTEAVLFETQATTDPHFLAGVRYYAGVLDQKGRYDEEFHVTDNTLTWMFHTDKWPDLLAIKKEAAFTPDVIERMKSNCGVPDKRELAAFISCNAGALAVLHRTPEAIKVEQDAMMVSPGDPRIRFAYGRLILSTDRPEALRQWEIAHKIAPGFAGCAASLAHERIVDGRYEEAVALLQPFMKGLSWDGAIWIDLAKAKIGLHDLRGAARALAGAQQAINAAMLRADIAELQKRITEMRAAGTAARP